MCSYIDLESGSGLEHNYFLLTRKSPGVYFWKKLRYYDVSVPRAARDREAPNDNQSTVRLTPPPPPPPPAPDR